MSNLQESFDNLFIKFIGSKSRDSFHLGYELKKYREDELIDFIRRDILGYCLTDKEYQEYKALPDKKDFLKKAWSRISTAPEDKQGDWGEFLLYAILKYHFKYDKKLTKVKIKTAKGQQVNGFDCAHFSIANEKLSLYLGEAKFYKDFDNALQKAKTSIESLLQIKKVEDEISILVDHLDNESDKESYNKARKILESGITLDEIKFIIPVLLTYNSLTVSEHEIENQRFKQDLKKEIEKKFSKINNINFNLSLDCKLEFILLPFYCVTDVKKKLKKIQDANI